MCQVRRAARASSRTPSTMRASSSAAYPSIKPGRLTAPSIVWVKRRRGDSQSGSLGRERHRVRARRQPADQVQAGPVAAGHHRVAEVGPERLQQSIAAGLVQPTHPPQVALEVALADEVGEHLLIEGRRLAVGQPLGGHERLDQPRRQHHEPDPQRRKERLREAADVRHNAVGVEPLERLQRPAQ